jgi:small subunit ribosomal protein S6
MNTYELMVIYNPTLGDAGVKSQIESLKKKIEGFGGKVDTEDFWGLKDLAYPMQGNTQAYYEVVTISLAANKVAELSDFLNKQEDAVVRNMISVVE